MPTLPEATAVPTASFPEWQDEGKPPPLSSGTQTIAFEEHP
jgi:hypothetical protein